MGTYQFEKIIIPYHTEELQAWKARDPQVVPSFALNWKGPGVKNGYGFAEWKAEQYFRGQGHYVNNNEFNLLSKKSKFEPYNQSIISILGSEKIEKFRFGVHKIIKQGFHIENPDLFVFNLDNHFFAEVKKDNDTLRKPQIHFMYLADSFLETESKLVYLSEQESTIRSEIVSVEVPF
jgi:hypothetical protein